MPKTTNEWLDRRYDLLNKTFGERKFTGDEAKKVLIEQGKTEETSAAVILTELKNQGYLEAQQDPLDTRKRVYSLIPKKDLVIELTSKKENLTRQDVYSILKRAADLIRTRVDYKFILILLFLKRISDKWQDEKEKAIKELVKDGLSEKEAEKEAKKSAYHEFDLPEEYLWDSLRNEVNELPEKFSRALKVLAELNPEMKDVLDNADFIQFTSNIENSEILRQLVELFSEKKLHHVSPDILGDAYEWILRFFAPDKAKEGEVYTPREVIKLIVEILKPEPGKSVYDPTSASNGMLIVAHKYVEEKYGKKEAEKLFLFGQEANHKTLALGRMNMYIHDIRNVQLSFGDTLLYPKFKDKDNLKQFDYIVSNPPWNQDGYDETVLKKGEFLRRFSYGFVPKQSADWAWIQHMLASAKAEDGKIGVVMDNGCLFRGGKEKGIREQILRDDLIECVLLLPEKLFYNTGAPGAILFLNKNKPANRKNNVLFINATNEFEKHPEVRKLNILSDKNIKHIIENFDEFKDEFNFSKVFSVQDILSEKNDSSLNVGLYVPIIEAKEEIDIEKEWQAVQDLKKEEEKIDQKIAAYLKEIK
jgi:type I restriction enzyme M protein